MFSLSDHGGSYGGGGELPQKGARSNYTYFTTWTMGIGNIQNCTEEPANNSTRPYNLVKMKDGVVLESIPARARNISNYDGERYISNGNMFDKSGNLLFTPPTILGTLRCYRHSDGKYFTTENTSGTSSLLRVYDALGTMLSSRRYDSGGQYNSHTMILLNKKNSAVLLGHNNYGSVTEMWFIRDNSSTINVSTYRYGEAMLINDLTTIH